MRYLLALIFLTASAIPAGAQSSFFKKNSLGIQGYFGSFLTNLPKAQYVRDSYSCFGEIYWEQQTDGSKEWQVSNRLPQLGIGAFYGNTGSRQYMGRMAGLFSYANITLFRTRWYKSRFRIGGGLGWVEKPYNRETNHKAVLIGSHINAYIQLMWQHEFRIAENIFANAALNFSHLSNGSTQLPNLGLNIPSISLGIRYGAEQPALQHRKLTFDKKTKLTVYTGAGYKQFPWIHGERFLVNLVQSELLRKFSYSDAYGGGIALFYDRSLEVDPSGILSAKREGNQFQAGAYLAYEHFFGKLSLPVQLGTYVVNRDIYAALFQQIGLRYSIHRQWKAQLLMKTHSGKADFIHLGLGYNIR